MEDILMQELENLRAENKILRDSLVEYRSDEPKEEEKSVDALLKDMTGKLNAAVGQMKEQLAPGTEKLTESLSRQMAENPVPLLLAAFGAGYLVSRALEHR